MNKVITNLIILLLISSCSLDKKKPETEDTNSEINETESEKLIDPTQTANNPQTIDSLFSFFKKTNASELLNFKVTASSDTYTSYSREEEIPLSYQPLFDGHLYPMEIKSTGYLPKIYFEINDSITFLIIFIQDDYGPVYHGLTFNTIENKILNSQILAREWGDAGDTQTIYSELELNELTLMVNKFITTCHAELDFDSNPVKVISEECSDSTYVATIK